MAIYLIFPLLFVLTLFSCGKSPEAPKQALSAMTSQAQQDTVAQQDPYVKYTYAERRGMRLFETYCSVCHGSGGQGDGFNSYNLDPRPHDMTDTEYMNAISDQTLHEVIAQGGRGVNKSILMPAYGHTLKQRDIDDLVAFIRTLAKPAP